MQGFPFSGGIASTRSIRTISYRQHFRTNYGRNELTYWLTGSERISSKSSFTAANWTMVSHKAFCISSTHSGTWINTFLVRASFIQVTVGINCAFGSTVWWTAKKTKQARANSLVIVFSTLAIRTTRRWTTRMNYFWF